MFTLGIIGRPNVGKSTLFNRIAGKRIAITDDMPGVTRDRIEFTANWMNKDFLLVDTAGFDLKEDVIKKEMQEQFFKTLNIADFFILVTDGSEGVHALDEVVVGLLRKAGKPFIVAVNKVDSESKELNLGEFYKLGADIELFGISALHGRNVDEVLDYVADMIPPSEEREDDEQERIKIAVIGRPNVGKSSLINAWLGEERVIVTPLAGTTRDAVDTLFEYEGTSYLLTDTAGIRKKSVMFKDPVEKFGYYRSMDAIARADIAVAVIDGSDGLNERDVKVISDAWEAGRPVVLAVNKWDIADKSDKAVNNFKQTIKEKLQFLSNPPILFISAAQGKNCFKIFTEVKRLYAAYTKRITTSKVNNVLEEALERHQPPVVGTRRLKFYYMTQVSSRPPYFVAFVNNPAGVHFSYERFIVNVIREQFDFDGVPVRLSIRQRSSRSRDDD
ncbi:MAG: ribosome biogenesis GTPase Der [Deferribacterales bacterium]|nr:ribosome biogenesis GTPase Der [Deferribacterales bacterium]